ncbi:MAG: hypothetical protein HYV16_05870 [Gammaproteobacteria bacterium]|nr:hypothetical protein [Gammaproteobacteria bacterium]
MKPGGKHGAGAALALVVLGTWLLWPDSAAHPPMASEPAATVSRPAGKLTTPISTPDAKPVAAAPTLAADAPANPAPAAETSAAPVLKPAAIASLRAARVHGDPRTPPIVRDETPVELPSAEELAEPQAYGRYEARQERRLKAAFLKAADPELAKLQRQLAEMKRLGMDERALAEAREKWQRLQALQTRLRAEAAER